jgi:hypothetical protein
MKWKFHLSLLLLWLKRLMLLSDCKLIFIVYDMMKEEDHNVNSFVKSNQHIITDWLKQRARAKKWEKIMIIIIIVIDIQLNGNCCSLSRRKFSSFWCSLLNSQYNAIRNIKLCNFFPLSEKFHENCNGVGEWESGEREKSRKSSQRKVCVRENVKVESMYVMRKIAMNKGYTQPFSPALALQQASPESWVLSFNEGGRK